MRRKNVLVCLAVLAVLIAPAISAPAISAQESNTLKASYGIFGTDVDDYMDVNNWKGVSESFDKGFGFVGGGRDAAAAPNAGGFQGGYATKLGGLYLGLFLDGQVWKGQGTDVFDDENKRQDTTDTGRLFVDGYYGVLLGGGFGGAKLFVDFDNTSHNYDFTDATTSTVINYSGNLTIGAAYGMITEGGLKPEVGVSYNIALNDYSDTDGDIVDIPTAADILNVYFTSNIPLKDENAWAGAKYKLDLGLHRPERDDPNDTKTTYLPTEWGNTLSGWYGKSWDIGERISVGFEFDLDLGVQLAQEVKTVGDADPAYGPMNTAFYIAPQAEVAVKYNFAKKPFSLIVGMQYAAHTVSDPYTDDVFWRVTRAEGRDSDNKSTGAIVTYDFNPLDIQFSLGGSWNPVPQFSVDATVRRLWFLNTPNSEFNFTGNAGITNVPLNFNLLFTLKI
jgi:hypothetical protein